MSKLYASIDQSARDTVPTARGHDLIETHTRGWQSGVRVRATIDEFGVLQYQIWLTGGSGHANPTRHIATISCEESTGRILDSDLPNMPESDYA